MSNYDIDDDDDPKETTRLVLDNAREMHRYDESHDSTDAAFARFLNYKNYDHLVYLSVLTMLICFPLGLVALLMALKTHEDAKSGYYDRAKKKAWITYLIIGAALLIDTLVVVIVIIVIKTK